MKKIILLSAALIIVTNVAFSQGTAINSTGAKADSSAILDLSSTTKGMLVPRMLKAEKLAISNPANGLLIYQTDDTTGFWYFNSVKWVQAVGPAGASGLPICTGAPPTPGPIIGSSTVNANTTYFFMVAPVTDATTYTWNYTGTGAVISGTTNPVSIFFTTSATGGDLTVTASCGNGNSTSVPLSITVIPVPHDSIIFNSTGSMQTWIVPAGVTSVKFDVRGARGYGGSPTNYGGLGGRAIGTLAVTPQQVFYIYVGGIYSQHLTAGGEAGNNLGGDASSVRTGIGLSSRIIVAGGGGGAGSTGGTNNTYGGAGGNTTGASGANNSTSNGGAGGTQSAGGAGGTGTTTNGGNGLLGAGGAAAGWSNGGGGGYYGGGGGGYGSACNCSAAGGGGSNYFSPLLTNTQGYQGTQNGSGQVIIVY